MTYRKKKSRLEPPRDIYESVPTVDPEEMSFAMQLFQAALRMKMPSDSPEKKGIEVGDAAIAADLIESLPSPLREQFLVRDTRIAPKDTPLNRAAFAILDHYKDDPQQHAFMSRATSYYFFVNDLGNAAFDLNGPLAKWLKPSEDDGVILLHPAIFHALAIVPATKCGFQRQVFLDTLEHVTAEHYGDTEPEMP